MAPGHHPQWRRLGTRTVHTTPWFEVREDSVVRPDGVRDVYHHVVSPGSITVVAVDDADRVAVTRQWIYTHAERQWRLPAGAIDARDASPRAAAERELAEETGVRAARWEAVGRVNGADSLTNHVDHVFAATDLTLGPDSRDAAEADLDVHWLSFREALDLVANGAIRHAGSVCGLLSLGIRRETAPRP
jgi:8-oxo-dGDP phosphatase